MSSNSKSGAKPKLACEVSADRILAARVADGEGVVSTCAAQELSPGSVIPDLIENNLVRRDSVRAAIQETLASIGAAYFGDAKDGEMLRRYNFLDKPAIDKNETIIVPVYNKPRVLVSKWWLRSPCRA